MAAVRAFASRPFLRFLAAALGAVAAAASPGSGAAPTSIPVGDTQVVLDAPSGYADTTYLGSPRLQDLAESLTPASNRVLLFAISDDDLRKFTLGDPPDFRRYMVVVTSKSQERERLSEAAFRRLADAMRSASPAPQAGTDPMKLIEKQGVGKAATLVELRNDATVVSQLQGTRLEPTKIPGLFSSDVRQNYMLSSATLMILRGHPVNLAVFTLYGSPEDAAWVRAVTLRWIDELQRLNR